MCELTKSIEAQSPAEMYADLVARGEYGLARILAGMCRIVFTQATQHVNGGPFKRLASDDVAYAILDRARVVAW